MMGALELLLGVEEDERRTGDLVRGVKIHPEYDCINGCRFDSPRCYPGSGGWHGIGGRRVIWSVAVVGRGAVALDLHTPIFTDAAMQRSGRHQLVDMWSPLGALDLHFAEAPWYLAEYGPKDCHLIEGQCWNDVTFLQAELGYETFVAGGTEAVWTWLGEAWLPRVINPELEEAS